MKNHELSLVMLRGVFWVKKPSKLFVGSTGRATKNGQFFSMANDGRIFLQSIEFAPSSSPDEEDLLEEDAKNDLALAFANRSAVWNDRGEHALAIRDADLAFEAKYPLELQHKLYERKGQCFMALGNFFCIFASEASYG